jgi:hypothetical protein
VLVSHDLLSSDGNCSSDGETVPLLDGLRRLKDVVMGSSAALRFAVGVGEVSPAESRSSRALVCWGMITLW